jgi:hypothetical protein
MILYFRAISRNLRGPMLALALISSHAAFAADGAAKTQTIVLVRHGEKPEGGLGQLDCQGLNRSLALPAVLANKFDKPLAIFAPSPSRQKDDSGEAYNYIRPLATIEPTAIGLGMPVNADYRSSDIVGLERALAQKSLLNGTVLVAWEHKLIVTLARDLVNTYGGDPATVPKKWQSDDFDSIYVLRIVRNGRTATVSFEHGAEGLNGQPTTCPGR